MKNNLSLFVVVGIVFGVVLGCGFGVGGGKVNRMFLQGANTM